MKGVVLTGFMGTGKTTVGKILADRYGLSFLDLDAEIEQRAGCSVLEVFDKYGEEHFRRLESEVVQSVGESSDSLIATGGGTLVTEANRKVLESDRDLFCLNCQNDRLRQRLSAPKNRPLLNSSSWEEIEQLFDERKETYDRYRQIDTTNRTPAQVAEEIGSVGRLSEVADLQFDGDSCSRIRFEQGLLSSAAALRAKLNPVGQVALVTDQTVAALEVCSTVKASLEEARCQVEFIVIPTGEEHKTLDTVRQMYGACLESGIERRATVIGLGGGVVCDIAGMLAATYLRGLRLVLIPTTLVAQADASIGGKVGVDFGGSKNLIGSFYPAELVLIDPISLLTVAPEQLSQGLAEIAKCGAVLNRNLFEAVERLRNAVGVLERPAIIRTAAATKAGIVERDPREHGERELLNFGHTVGHALESATDFRVPHGSAVGLGMLGELYVGRLRGWCSTFLEERLERLLEALGLPTRLEGIDQEKAWHHMQRDKKRRAKAIRFAIPTNLGEGAVFEVNESDAKLALNRVLGGLP